MLLKNHDQIDNKEILIILLYNLNNNFFYENLIIENYIPDN